MVILRSGQRADSSAAAARDVATAILEAAATVFYRSGFADCTLAAIAAEAGCSLAELEAHFEDKHELHESIVVMIQREAKELFMLTLPDEIDIVEKLRLLLTHQAEWGNRRRETLSFLARPEPQNAGRARGLDLDDYYLEGTVGWFERHDVAGELGLAIPGEMAAHVFRALQIGFYDRWVARGGSESFLDNTDMVLDIFLNGVRTKKS